MCFLTTGIQKTLNFFPMFNHWKFSHKNSRPDFFFFSIKRCNDTGLPAYMDGYSQWDLGRWSPLLWFLGCTITNFPSHWSWELVPLHQFIGACLLISKWFLVGIFVPDLYLTFMYECLKDNKAWGNFEVSISDTFLSWTWC